MVVGLAVIDGCLCDRRHNKVINIATNVSMLTASISVTYSGEWHVSAASAHRSVTICLLLYCHFASLIDNSTVAAFFQSTKLKWKLKYV